MQTLASEARVRTPATEGPRNLLLIVIDCLRADHVSCYGYHRPTTPTLDRLAQHGVRWSYANSASCWTKPSVASLFSGQHPTAHGAVGGVKRKAAGSGATTDTLRSTAPTLAEDLSARGWRCAALMNNVQLGSFTGLDRGFHVYESQLGKADHIIEAFCDWVRDQTHHPWFVYLHLLEAHWPYKPRRRHVRMFGGDRDSNVFRDFSGRDFGRLRQAVSRRELALTCEQITHMVQLYDGAIRRLDGKIKKILGILEERGQRDATQIVVTADHGEEFLEHGRIGHGQSLYEELIHVPLVTCGPGSPSGIVIEEPVSHVDLGHTMVKCVSGETSMPGRDLYSPNSASAPVLAEVKTAARYRQSLREGPWKIHRTYELNGNAGQPPTLVAAAVGPIHAKRVELYNLSVDPGEQNDLSEKLEFSDIRAKLTSKLTDLSQQTAAEGSDDRPATIELDDCVVRRLRDLGYLE